MISLSVAEKNYLEMEMNNTEKNTMFSNVKSFWFKHFFYGYN